MEQLSHNLQLLVLALPYFAILILTLWLGKLVYARTSRYHFDEELTTRDNGAFGVHLALYLVGLMIAVGGTLFRGKLLDLAGLAIVLGFSLLCVGLMRLSVWVNARFLLREFCIYKEMIDDRNVGTGFVVGGACVATGLMINGAFSVQTYEDMTLAGQVGQALLVTLVFYVIGQALLVAGGWVFRLIARFDVHHTIEHDDNLAAGVAYGGFLVAVGLVVRSALVNASPDLGVEIATTLAYAALGLVLLAGARLFIEKVLLPDSPLGKEVATDRNPAAGAVAAACFIGVGLAFTWAVTAATIAPDGGPTP